MRLHCLLKERKNKMECTIILAIGGNYPIGTIMRKECTEFKSKKKLRVKLPDDSVLNFPQDLIEVRRVNKGGMYSGTHRVGWVVK